MKLFIGIDLGTSAVKLLLVDETGAIVRETSREYPLIFPHPGWSEQEPSAWWNAVRDALRLLFGGADGDGVDEIGASAVEKVVDLKPVDAFLRRGILEDRIRAEALVVVGDGHD